MAVTDLTGTKWLLNSSISGYFKNKNITFTSNGNNYSSIRLNDVELNYGSTLVGSFNKSGDFTWSNEAYRTISITGGTDVTNSDLIAWLQANATQIQEQSNTFSFGNLPIANMYFGTQQVKKVYMGNTLVWEKEETGYTVTLRLGGTNETYTAGYICVYAGTHGDFDYSKDPLSQSNLIFSQNPLDPSAYPVTLTIKSGYCSVLIETNGGSIDGAYISSNDFTETDSRMYNLGLWNDYRIDKNGTIEFGATDWDD